MVFRLICGVLIIVVPFQYCKCDRILVVMPTPSYSHQIVFNPLWLGLHARGHNLTLLTTNPIQNASLTATGRFRQIDWSFAYDIWHTKHNLSEIIKNFNSNIVKCFNQYVAMMNDVINQELDQPQVRALIRNDNNERFDMVIVEFLHPAMMAFSERFKCPFIGVSPMDLPNFGHDSAGNPTNPAIYSDFIMPFDVHMTFLERVANTLYYVGSKLYFKYYFYPKVDNIVRAHFGDNMPSLEHIQRKVSMIFLNTNPILHDIRPLMPNILPVGCGIHLGPENPLPKDLQEFLDGASSNGAIYFSLGTNVNLRDFPGDILNVLIEVFAELPYKILWKFEDPNIIVQPNIMIKPWLPQTDILNHPNIKLFITQGGLQSLEEAIYYAVPILGMPFYVDQFANMRRLIRKGVGLQINYNTIGKDEFRNAIKDVIENKTYKDNARLLSNFLTEKPVSSLDEAVFWVEYILKHKNVKLLKRPFELPWYQYLLLDVIGVIVASFCICLYIQYKLLIIFIVYIKSKRRGKRVKLE